MSDQNVNPQLVEQARRQVNRLAEEIAHLSEAELSPPEYYGEFLQRVLAAIAAPAGAVWIRTSQGNLILQYQIRMREVGMDNVENGRQMHDELLRQAVMQGKPTMLAPQSGLGEAQQGQKTAPGNPTNYQTLIAPIMVEKQVAGLVEVWQDPNRPQEAQRGFLQFVVRMAGLASSYTRNHQLRQMTSQQQVWSQLETFAKQVHGTLNPTEVAYQVANEGRRLIECDRISVGIREGQKCVVRAISGADVVEKRSNLVQLMRALFDEVLKWGEKLVYSGTKDETLPPKVLRALDDYLAESNSKLLVIMPLHDERDKDKNRLARSILMMESFEPQGAPEQMTAKLEVVAKHAASALYNATQYRQIPFRFIWGPMAKVQEGLGGKTKAILTLITFAFFLLLATMILVPWPLKMDANGQLQPKNQRWIFAPVAGRVVGFAPGLKNGTRVSENQNLIKMESTDLADQIFKLQTETNKAAKHANMLRNQLDQATGNVDPNEINNWQIELSKHTAVYEAKLKQLRMLQNRTNAVTGDPGVYWLKSPLSGIVLSHNFKKTLINRAVQPNEPILHVGYVGDPKSPDPNQWHVELKIPQKNIGQVLAAFNRRKPGEELDVDFLLGSKSTMLFKGKLALKDISTEATPDRTDNNEAENVVIAWVRISGEDIPRDYRIGPEYLLTGTEVHSRIYCGDHAMGYSLFYGVWEFIYENIVFFF